jgi:hypothetical protein
MEECIMARKKKPHTAYRYNSSLDPAMSWDESSAELEVSPEKEPFNGDPVKFRLGIEAIRLGLAYEYDPYFSLSIAGVDPLPHQLEAVYDYFLKLPRILFLLADHPGADKTIVAGLLIKELKVRGLVPLSVWEGCGGSAGSTVLDQLHQSMILFGAGRGEALKRFLVEDGVGLNPLYWRLAQALSALYPSGTDEKRWVDGVLARKKGLGF